MPNNEHLHKLTFLPSMKKKSTVINMNPPLFMLTCKIQKWGSKVSYNIYNCSSVSYKHLITFCNIIFGKLCGLFSHGLNTQQ